MLQVVVSIAIFLFAASSALAGAYADFFHAVKADNPQEVQYLLREGFDPNAVTKEGNSALYMALRYKASKVARLLIDQPSIKLNQLNPSGESALMIACLLGEKNLVQRMVEQGAAVNKTGWTPLSYAATNGHAAIARFLLKHGAVVDAPAPNGTTPLMMAAYFDHVPSVKLLLDAGANPQLKNAMGYTALDLAIRRGYKAEAQLMSHHIAKGHPNGHR